MKLIQKGDSFTLKFITELVVGAGGALDLKY